MGLTGRYDQQFDPVEKAEHYKKRIELDRFDPLSEQSNAYKTDSLPEDVKREIETLLRSMNFSLHYMGFSVLPPYLSTEIQNKGFTYMSPDEIGVDKKGPSICRKF